MMMPDPMDLLKVILPLKGEITIGDAEFEYHVFVSKFKGKEALIIAIPTKEITESDFIVKEEKEE